MITNIHHMTYFHKVDTSTAVARYQHCVPGQSCRSRFCLTAARRRRGRRPGCRDARVAAWRSQGDGERATPRCDAHVPLFT
eukprot:2984516-Pleurochrysis_carterae.AAC.1